MGEEKLSSLSKGLQVLRKFVFDKEDWGVRELARELGLPKSAAERVLQNLAKDGFLEVRPQDRRYVIGPELWRLGVALRGRKNFPALAMSILRRHAEAVNETMVFFTYGGGGVIFEDVAECDHPLRFSLKLGVPYSLHQGPAGKAILAALPAGERERVYESLANDPGVDVRTLRAVVEQARVEGYASARGERVQGVIGFAAPVLGPEGGLRGGVGLYLPEARYRAENRQRYVDTVKACADDVRSVAAPL
ncbi:MAG: IclR family transcriptional regulator [Deltaproteobacteria bacterium]|nr:IclR family transcriptional regulator [Deltaproteobacteria bacterium]